jgi:hypothetical protein
MVDPDKIQEYLNAVRKGCWDWWKPYAAFMDEIDDSTWFEFGLEVKRKVSPGKQEEEPKKENSPKPVLSVLDECVNEPILIIGSPGAGKSTLLAKLLFEAAQRALQDSTFPIPVLIELNLYDESKVWGLIQSLRVDSSPLCGVKCRDERVHPQTT